MRQVAEVVFMEREVEARSLEKWDGASGNTVVVAKE